MNAEKTLLDFVKQAKSSIQEIEVSDVQTLLEEGYQVLDVREPVEFSAGTIAGAFAENQGNGALAK